MAYTILYPLIIAIIVSLMMIPVVRSVSFRTGKVAIPRSDRWHRKPTPTLGGVGMFIAFTIVLFIVYFSGHGHELFLKRWSILSGIALMFFVGVFDDFKPISPPIKVVFQLIAATMVIFFGGNTINFFRWPIANIILTFLWLIGITNAINLLDNMDGLAGGVALIASGFLSIFFWRTGYPDLLILSLAIGGSIIGFLVFNFPPAKIFMGDSGSMMLGFSLAALAVARRTQASNIFAIVGVPTLVFLLPILDTGLVAITRILRGKSPAMGGTDHTSHRLVAFGLSERQAVLVLYTIAIVSGLASIGLEALDYDLSLVLIPVLLIFLSLFVAYLARMKVVSAEEEQLNGFTRWIVNLTFKRRIFELIFDLLLIGVSYYLAFWTRYGLNMTNDSMSLFLSSWPITLGVTYGSFYILGIYRGVWRYIGINDLIRYVGAAIISGGLAWIITKLALPNQIYPGEVFLLFILFLVIGLAGSRSSFLVLDRFYVRQFTGVQKENVLLYGATDAGEIALRWILRTPTTGYDVVGFLDDDELKWGSNIHGVNIIGNLTKLDQAVEERQVRGVIVTEEKLLHTAEGESLAADCRAKGIWLRVLRLEFELTA
jgi:UDP-GlcNAc:undecaprenyl-phosphate/decaprenyl-phosphate GlcNAc-1-phosphate transferase